ncbi:MAG: EF-P lysine aminoacylase EpmA [Steroidobacteraceae bacterium]
MSTAWRPVATLQALRQRAALLDCVRAFFRARGVLEVETPAVLAYTVTDVQIESLTLTTVPARYLQSSPEYPMKRLLAAGSGDIVQICRVFRAGERSRLHNPEFTMIEWYRLDHGLHAIMAETAALAAELLRCAGRSPPPVQLLSYRDAFQAKLGCDPLSACRAELDELCAKLGLATQSIATATRDDLLDFLIATQVGPGLGRDHLTCLHHFPAAQAALAQIDAEDPRTALRFELYAEGVELANGYVELGSSNEQRQRFRADQVERQRRGLAQPEMDVRLLAALEHGLPPCAGVAMGFDRVAMLACGTTSIDAVQAFPWENA